MDKKEKMVGQRLMWKGKDQGLLKKGGQLSFKGWLAARRKGGERRLAPGLAEKGRTKKKERKQFYRDPIIKIPVSFFFLSCNSHWLPKVSCYLVTVALVAFDQ